LLRDVMFRRVIAKFTENLEIELRKIDKYTHMCECHRIGYKA